MDDLKVYTYSKWGLSTMVNVVERVSKAIGMELDLRKCALAHMVVHDIHVKDHTLAGESAIDSLTQGDVYRYMGIEEMFKHSLGTIKERVNHTYLQIINLKIDTGRW